MTGLPHLLQNKLPNVDNLVVLFIGEPDGENVPYHEQLLHNAKSRGMG